MIIRYNKESKQEKKSKSEGRAPTAKIIYKNIYV